MRANSLHFVKTLKLCLVDSKWHVVVNVYFLSGRSCKLCLEFHHAHASKSLSSGCTHKEDLNNIKLASFLLFLKSWKLGVAYIALNSRKAFPHRMTLTFTDRHNPILASKCSSYDCGPILLSRRWTTKIRTVQTQVASILQAKLGASAFHKTYIVFGWPWGCQLRAWHTMAVAEHNPSHDNESRELPKSKLMHNDVQASTTDYRSEDASKQRSALRTRLWQFATWVPPRCRWDATDPPKFTLALNLLFGFVGDISLKRLFIISQELFCCFKTSCFQWCYSRIFERRRFLCYASNGVAKL